MVNLNLDCFMVKDEESKRQLQHKSPRRWVEAGDHFYSPQYSHAPSVQKKLLIRDKTMSCCAFRSLYWVKLLKIKVLQIAELTSMQLISVFN